MFSLVSVRHSVHWGVRGACDHYSRCIESRCTGSMVPGSPSTSCTLDMRPPAPLPAWTSDMGPPCGHYPWCIEPHCTGPPMAQACPPPTLHMRPTGAPEHQTWDPLMWPLPMMHWTSLYRPPVPWQPWHKSFPPWTSDMGPSGPALPPLDIWHGPPWWHLVAITGDLFKVVHLRTFPHQYWHLVTTEARTVGKRAVRILLECFFLKCNFYPRVIWRQKPVGPCNLSPILISFRVCLDQLGGVELDAHGAKKRRWSWKDRVSKWHEIIDLFGIAHSKINFQVSMYMILVIASVSTPPPPFEVNLYKKKCQFVDATCPRPTHPAHHIGG